MTTKTVDAHALWLAENPLRKWIKKHKRPHGMIGAVADFCRIRRQTVYRWLVGASIPSVKHATQLAGLTRGQVTLMHWVKWWERRPGKD